MVRYSFLSVGYACIRTFWSPGWDRELALATKKGKKRGRGGGGGGVLWWLSE